MKLPGDWGVGVGAGVEHKQPARWLLTQRERAWVDGLKGMALLKIELLDCGEMELRSGWTAELLW